jgi:hypothetical protein
MGHYVAAVVKNPRNFRSGFPGSAKEIALLEGGANCLSPLIWFDCLSADWPPARLVHVSDKPTGVGVKQSKLHPAVHCDAARFGIFLSGWV